MKKTFVLATLSLFLITVIGAELNRASEPVRKPARERPQPSLAEAPPVLAYDAMDLDTFVLAEFDFEGMTAPDPQGWTTADITEQIGVYWHVDDFMVPSGGGNQAMWCGVRDPLNELCAYGCLPGYGNNWRQWLETPTPFAVQGDVTWSFVANWDTEADYDRILPQYLNKNSNWVSIGWPGFDGIATDSVMSYVIPAADLNGSVRLRLRFESDNVWSDEDCLYDSNGAIQVDNITVADATGVLHVEDFEDEALGAQVTDDGVWLATVEPGAGNHAGMLDAGDLFLANPDNDSYVWGFTRDSPSTCFGSYNCFPGCGPDSLHVVPGRGWNDDEVDFHNEIWSPAIDWTQDINSNPVDPAATVTLLQFRVYRHMSLEGGVGYRWRVRSFEAAATCLPLWETNYPFVNFGSQGDWYTFTVDISDYLDPAPDLVQIALSAEDQSALFCYGIPECGDCLTVSPLFDDVRVLRCKPVASGIEEQPSFEDALAANYPNPFNPVTTIEYSIRERAHVSLKIYDVSGQLVRTLVDEVQTPGGVTPARWDGTNDSGEVVSSGVYFYRLVTGDFAQTRKLVLLK